MKRLLILPVRSGSKRIKDKNIQNICGFSLIEIALKKIINLDNFDILLSSDSYSYFEHANSFINENSASTVLNFHRRSDMYSDSKATLENVLDEILEIQSIKNKYKDIFVHQCTSPFLKRSTISKIVQKYESEELDSIFSVSLSHPFIWKRDLSNKNSGFSPLFDNSVPRKGTNKIDNISIETGAIYGFSLEGYLRERKRSFGKTYPFNVAKNETLDIDDYEDLKLANLLYPVFKNELFD